MEGKQTIALRKLSSDIFKVYHNFVCVEDYANIIRYYQSRVDLNKYSFAQAYSLLNTRLKVISDQAGFNNYIQIADDLSQLLRKRNANIDYVAKISDYFNDICIRISRSKDVYIDVQYAVEDLFESQSKYPSSLDYIHNLIDENDHPILDKEESYQLRVLKLLIAECRYKVRDLAKLFQSHYQDIDTITKKDLIPYTLSHVNETIFDNKLFNKLEIVQCAKDIVQAKFTRAGGVRKNIYILAYALKMKYYLKHEKRDLMNYDPHKDVEKQLFDNFYGIEDLNEIVVLGGEKNPSAAGANYKNFMELCYLHGLRKGYSFNDVQIIIDRCSKIKKEDNARSSDLLAVTKDFQDSYLAYLENEPLKIQAFSNEMSKKKKVTNKMIENAEKDFFIEYVSANYDCSRKEMAIAQEQLSAYQTYSEMMKEILEDRYIDESEIETISNAIIDLIKTKVELNQDEMLIVYAGKEKKKDVIERINKMIETQELTIQLQDYIASIDFSLNQLLSIEAIMKEKINEVLINDLKNVDYGMILDDMNSDAYYEHPCMKLYEMLNDETLFNKDANSISRYSLMIIFMYWWDITSKSGDVTFVEYKNALIATLNDKLIQSRYQPFDNKNFFDVVIVLILFYNIKMPRDDFNY